MNLETQGEDCWKKEKEIWVFGYASFLWKTGFPYQDKVVGFIKGYMRRFWQGSTDHRGVPGSPGRVVTLIENEQECTWGLAYQVNPADVPEVLAYLNHRERGGYTTRELMFYPQDRSRNEFIVLVYIATESNPLYLGPAPLHEIAQQIVVSQGESGLNTEYLFELARSMRLLAPSVSDEHLFELEKKVKELLGLEEKDL